MNIIEKLVLFQQRGHYKMPHLLLALFGLEIPAEVEFPQNLGGGTICP